MYLITNFLFLSSVSLSEKMTMDSLSCRFRSRLSQVYGVGEKTSPIVYSGRGRPPKRALMPLDVSSRPNEAGGDSSDEGEVRSNLPSTAIVGVASDSEYSEEETDEEVCVCARPCAVFAFLIVYSCILVIIQSVNFVNLGIMQQVMNHDIHLNIPTYMDMYIHVCLHVSCLL